MRRETRITLIGVIGLILLVMPMLVRSSLFRSQSNPYVPPPTDEFTTAATPIPTNTPLAQLASVSEIVGELPPGPVVVDLAHFNRLDRSKFQPLASALAQRGVSMRFWLPVGIDPMQIQSFLDFPDQSEKLAAELEDASALVIVSPFFLWTPKEIAQVVQFVADGGLLYLVSDPDNIGDVARDINNVGDPFGVVFSDDYLYNTQRNDENFTYTFQGEFLDRAAELAGREIVFYGARSIIGSVTPQIISDGTTLSSARTGVTGFTTVALAGLPTNETEGRVLAMSDFDVLSEPFVTRFQNRSMVDFVADFLAGSARINTLTDFPNSLGKEVALVYGSENTVDGELLTMSAQLQQRLTRSGRELTLAQSAPLIDGQIISSTRALTGALASRFVMQAADVLSDTLSTQLEQSATLPPTPTPLKEPAPLKESVEEIAAQPLPTGDLIYLADFQTAGEETSLLADAGFTLIQVARTPTPTPSPTPTATSSTPTATVTATATGTPSPTATLMALEPSINVTDTLTTTASISGTTGITVTVPITSDQGTAPLEESDLLTGTEAVSGTVEIAGTPAVTETNELTATDSLTETDALTTSTTITSSVTLSETATPEPIITAYLVSDGGLQLLAEETILLLQVERAEEGQLVAVLGASDASIQAGVKRLLDQDYSGCVLDEHQVVCPYAQSDATPTPTSRSNNGNGGTPTATPIATIPGGTLPPEGTPAPETTPQPTDEPIAPGAAKILIIDDNDVVAEGETSEAEFYVTTLVGLGTSPELWDMNANGTPTGDALKGYDWILWSSAGYSGGGPSVADLDPIFEYLNEGGHITISSRNTFFGQTQDPPSVVRDVRKTDDIPALVNGLPTAPIILSADTPAVAPLQANTAENPSLTVVLRRGPESEDADAPLLFVLVDDDPAATDARLMVLGMSPLWLPGDVSEQLISNMMVWMLE